MARLLVYMFRVGSDDTNFNTKSGRDAKSPPIHWDHLWDLWRCAVVQRLASVADGHNAPSAEQWSRIARCNSSLPRAGRVSFTAMHVACRVRHRDPHARALPQICDFRVLSSEWELQQVRRSPGHMVQHTESPTFVARVIACTRRVSKRPPRKHGPDQ